MTDEVFILTDVGRADDLEAVIENASDIRPLRFFNVVRFKARTTDVHKNVKTFGADDCPVATETMATLEDGGSGGIEFADEALIMFTL